MEKEQPQDKPIVRDPAPEVAARGDVRVAGSLARCPYCHSDIVPRDSEWVACWGCLARHHPDCWDETGKCSTCGHDRFLPAELARKTPSRFRRLAARFLRAARVPAFGIALYLLGPLLGLAYTIHGMITSFHTIATLKSPTPKDLAEGVYASLWGTTVGLALALVGGLIFAAWLIWFVKSRVAPRASAKTSDHGSSSVR